MQMKKRVSRLVGTFWRQIAIGVAVVVSVVGVLWYQLGTLVPFMSIPELAARADANSIHKIIDNPLFLPHKLLQYTLLRFDYTGAFWMRSVSALVGVFILITFYRILRSWYSQRIALIGSFLLLTSAWFLHFARSGTPLIMFGCSIGLLWVGIRIRSHQAPRIRTVLAGIIIMLSCLYVPGLVWLILPFIVWQRKVLWHEFSKLPKLLAAVVVLGALVALTPLVYSFVKDPDLIRQWLLIPNAFEPRVWLGNTWRMPFWFTLRGPTNPVFWLGHVPLLNSLSVVMFVLGVFVFYHFRLLDRVRATTAIIFVSCALAIFNGFVALTIGLPLFFIVISAGIALLLQQWFTVFPRNPLARTVGVTMVVCIVALAGYYNMRHYFIAWPRAAETIQAYRQPQ